MRADICYQTSAKQSLPLVLLGTQDLNEQPLTAFEKNCLANCQFKGLIGDLAIVPTSEGEVSKVFIGVSGGSDTQAINYVVNRLPLGCYTIQQTLSPSAILAWSLAQYQFDRYKATSASPRTLLVRAQELPAILAEAHAVFLVRDLINTPTNDLGPKELAEVVANLAKEYEADFKEWVGEELLVDNFPAIHAVGRAAADAPRLLSLTWGNNNHPKVTLVGKGVCFDSGGLNIKVAGGMRIMKKDMGGAAQVIGLAQWMMSKRLPIRLQVLIPAVENAISSQSFRPGDVLTMRNGLKVEIDNTDAEGRLILADALTKACEDKPELLIDFSTLTGAARVAVGTEIAAMFTNDETLAQALTQASSQIDDPVWRMPLFSGYANMLDSKIANLVNTSSSPYAGAITAALFLQHFIQTGVSWAHFDIMAWNLGNKPGKPEGGEAMGMQTLGHYLLQRYG